MSTALEQYQRERAVASLRRLKEIGPQTDEQLWYWIWYILGFHIAWRAVCPEHVAPFRFLADMYFGRVSSAAVHGARGSGKTRDLSILHLLDHHYRDGFQTSHVGAIQRQANLNYSYLKEYFRDPHFRRALAQDPLMSETRWKNGSRLEVLPGCLPGYQRVITPDGPVRIEEIVAKRLPGPVLSYDFGLGEWQWRRIVDWFSNGPTTEWIRGRLDPGKRGPSDFKLTPGHEVVVPGGRKVPLGCLSEGDEVLVHGQILSDEQAQVLLGLMLGDGSVKDNAGVLRVSHAYWQRSYLDWIVEVFSEFGGTVADRPAKATFAWESGAALPFSLARRDWYGTGVKRIPLGTFARLSRLGLAVWVMDDGGYSVSGPWHGRGRPTGFWKICAMSFDRGEREAAGDYLRRLGVTGRWRPAASKTGERYEYCCSSPGSARLTELVAPWIDVSTKGPKGQGYKRWRGGPITQHSGFGAVPVRIGRLERTARRYWRYDITVEGTHNYALCSGLLVGNTIGATSGPHPNFCVADEFDLMAWDVYQQFVGMPMSSDRYPAQTLYASAMVTSFGPMNRLLTEAPARGIAVYASCLLDCMEPCATCEDAERVKRGVEMKPHDCLLWEDCQGRVREATGHIKKADAINRRLQSDDDTWNCQSLCRTVSRKGLVYENWVDAPGDPDSNVTEEAEYTDGVPVVWLGDDGFSPDPMVLLAAQEMPNGQVHVFDEMYTNMTLYEEVVKWLSEKRELDAAGRETGIWYWQETTWEEGRKAELTGQARAYRKPSSAFCGSTDKQLQSYIRQLGVPVKVPTKTGVVDGVKEVRRMIRDAQGHRGLLVHPRCRWLRRDMGQYHRKQISSGIYAEEPADNTGRSNPDDGADCLRVFAACRLESRGQRIKAV